MGRSVGRSAGGGNVKQFTTILTIEHQARDDDHAIDTSLELQATIHRQTPWLHVDRMLQHSDGTPVDE